MSKCTAERESSIILKWVMRMGILGDLETCSIDGSGISTYEPIDTIG